MAEADRASWNATSEAALIAHLSKAVLEGLQSDNNFKNKVYTAAAEELGKQGYEFNAKQVKSRWGRFKEEYKIVEPQ